MNVRYLAPAKLNLFLHITGRRSDGYHDLETVFQLVDLCDELDIEVRDDGRIMREPPPSDAQLAALPDADDLTVRAARLLQQAGDVRSGASIHVSKRIPAGGGLGGGSSDAAAVLLALNSLWKLHWSRERLAALALQLGADVPVFVQGRNAFARGRGEQLTPVDLPPRWFVIADPGVPVSTREIFSAPELTRNTPPLTIASTPPDGGHNDCEPVVRARNPAVARVLDLLAPHGGRLTGTGGCVFASRDSRQAAEDLAQQLSSQVRVFVARGLRQSPL
ncbi:MAG TPA: 4-(cytidine 5'-diphospho)-2-C-methyl-D-erythritol kinase [Steroidobacteraceae bacterium]|nr:4-(cytidine 5'-diphospho)-2-C-methyl-D-erythritol kinase [Steroidobacteraceae bacterium]